MNRDLLSRFFENETTLDEEKLIRHWIEASDANKKFFMDERIAYDTMLMSSTSVPVAQKRTIKLSPWMWGVAASIVLLLSIGSLLLVNLKDTSPKYSTIIVPPGQHINLVLEDSTKVWLNANTTFRFPNEFAKEKRTVYLDGEGYFEVAKNVNKPFTVKTQKGDVLVTGTKFNVEAYPKESLFETSLFEGGVELYQNSSKLASLKPNQKSQIVNGKVSVLPIDEMESYLWRKGLVAFKNKKLEEILNELSQSFSVKFEISSKKLPQQLYTGKFRQSEGIEYALQVLKQSIDFSYRRDYETGIIYIK